MREGWGNSWKGRRMGRERKLEADEKEKGRKLERKGRGKLERKGRGKLGGRRKGRGKLGKGREGE